MNELAFILSIVITLYYQSFAAHYDAGDCKRVIAEGLSEDDEKFVVDKHNEIRKMIATGQVEGQPKGIDMKKMKYDKKIAEKAQKFADKCNPGYELYTDVRWDDIGQNIFTAESDTEDMENETWEAAIQFWLDTKEAFEYGPLDIPCICLDYTQIVWADTDHIGCGMKHYETKSGKPKYVKFFACYYGPAGNVDGEYPYKAGEKGCNDTCEVNTEYLG